MNASEIIAQHMRQEEEAQNRLRELFPKGSTVYTVLDGNPSASGMTRWINVYAMRDNEPVYAAGQMSIAYPRVWKRGRFDSKHPDSIKVSGAGMDMGFHVAYTLSQQLYGDGYALNHRWL